jgi:amino acid transporter
VSEIAGAEIAGEGAADAPFERSMGGFGALMITLSGLSPTIGVFVVGADVIHQAGTGAALCFAAAALLGVAMALVYAELVSAFPETGAEYTIITRTIGPALGFAALGLNLVNFTVAQALSGLGVADYLEGVLPGVSQLAVALVLVAGVTVLAVLNVRFNAILTGIFLVLEVGSLATLSWLGFSHPHRGLAEVVLHPVAVASGGRLATASLAVMGAAASAAVYAFDGYGGVCSLGEEVREAPRKVAGVVFWSLGLAIVFQMTPVLAVMVGAPDVRALVTSAQPLPDFILATGGPVMARVLSIGVAIAIFNAMLALSLLAARQLYATGRDRLWPALMNRALTRLHPRFRSPWVAALTMGGVSLAWCLAPLDFLVTVIATVTVATYVGLCVAVIAGRRTRSTSGGVYRMPLYPLAPLLGLAALGGVIFVSWSDPHEGRPGLVATALVIAVSLLVYGGLRLTGSRWADRGPGRASASRAAKGDV